MSQSTEVKQRLAKAAAAEIENGMVVGLGTGSTANAFIEALANRYHQQGIVCTAVASSISSGVLAQQLGLPLQGIEQTTRMDIYVDSADEVTDEKWVLKGRGSDLVKEKLFAAAADRVLIIGEQSKWVKQIGAHYPIPIEVMPMAWTIVKQQLARIGGLATLRSQASGEGQHVTAHGSVVLDTTFDTVSDYRQLAMQLSAMPGVVEHGLFIDNVDEVWLADATIKILRQW